MLTLYHCRDSDDELTMLTVIPYIEVNLINEISISPENMGTYEDLRVLASFDRIAHDFDSRYLLGTSEHTLLAGSNH